VRQPQLIELDPRLITFNAQNPSKHRGEEYSSLKQSLGEIGIVQLPTVRVLPGGFYECIDGEGRVRSFQESVQERIWVISFGIVSDHDALIMLNAANVVRYFGFFAECKGMAKLHAQGMNTRTISEKLGRRHVTVKEQVAIGYFPDDIIEMMQQDVLRGQERVMKWSNTSLRIILPLRQIIPGKLNPERTGVIDQVYSYTEVREAVRLIVDGTIANQDQLGAYVERRMREIFESRFDQELHARIQAELDTIKLDLEESYQQKLEQETASTSERYASQVAALSVQYKELEKQYAELDIQRNKLIRDVARRPEIIEQREQELREKVAKAEEERVRFATLQEQVRQEMQKAKEQAQLDAQKARDEARAAIESQLSAAIKEQRREMDEQLAKTKQDMENYYAQRDGERQLKAETSLRQAIAHGKELLNQTQLSFLHLTEPGYLKGISWLSDAEIAGLLAEIMVVQSTLDDSRQLIQEVMQNHSEAVPAGVRTIEERT
jgi:hypothetical protein